MRQYKEMYKNEQYKRRPRVNRRKTRETHRGAWKDRTSDGLLEIHTTAAPLRSATGRIHMLQALRSGHKYPEELELPSEW